MLSLERLRKADHDTIYLTDDELTEIRQSFYDFGQLIFEDWKEQKFGSKYPVGLFPDKQARHKIEPWKTPPPKQG